MIEATTTELTSNNPNSLFYSQIREQRRTDRNSLLRTILLGTALIGGVALVGSHINARAEEIASQLDLQGENLTQLGEDLATRGEELEASVGEIETHVADLRANPPQVEVSASDMAGQAFNEVEGEAQEVFVDALNSEAGQTAIGFLGDASQTYQEVQGEVGEVLSDPVGAAQDLYEGSVVQDIAESEYSPLNWFND